jgi:hypothetical protein
MSRQKRSDKERKKERKKQTNKQTKQNIILISLGRACLYGINALLFFVAQDPRSGPGLLTVEVFRSHTLRHTTVGRTPLNER